MVSDKRVLGKTFASLTANTLMKLNFKSSICCQLLTSAVLRYPRGNSASLPSALCLYTPGFTVCRKLFGNVFVLNYTSEMCRNKDRKCLLPVFLASVLLYVSNHLEKEETNSFILSAKHIFLYARIFAFPQ